jgi:hypothetical protein
MALMAEVMAGMQVRILSAPPQIKIVNGLFNNNEQEKK